MKQWNICHVTGRPIIATSTGASLWRHNLLGQRKCTLYTWNDQIEDRMILEDGYFCMEIAWRGGTRRGVLGRFPFSQNFRISGSAVNGTRFVGSSHWKIPRKSGKSKKVGPFSRLEFPKGISRSIYSFLVVCTSSRSTVRKSVGHCDVPGFTTKWNNVLPIGNSTFAPTEISRFFSQMESALNIGYLRG